MKEFWILIAIICGAFLPIQAALNTRLGKAIASPAYATMFTFAGALITVLFYILLTKQRIVWTAIKTVPLYTWFAGMMGAFYVMGVVMALSRVGPALTFGLVVAGQMVIALILEHFDILVPQQHSVNIWRILGVLLILTGVVIIRKY